MSDADKLSMLSDQNERNRIANDLDTNFLVEAGAGSGKTSGLIRRMLALIRTGKAEVHEIAAITFTRKAAAELRERFQIGLESACRNSTGQEHERFSRALVDFERCFIGTIHSFCSRLLRERAIDAGIDPSFEEIEGIEEKALANQAWEAYLESHRLGKSTALQELAKLGVVPEELRQMYEVLSGSLDVEPQCQPSPFPDLTVVRSELGGFFEHAKNILPANPDPKGWDPLQKRLRRIIRLSKLLDLDDAVQLFRLLEVMEGKQKVVQKRWPSSELAKSAKAWYEEFGQRVVEPALRAWRRYRHPELIKFALGAARFYEGERRRLGVMNFQDLLMAAAKMLRENPHVRQYFSRIYPCILVDEFQDTDPIQAEMLLLLTGEPLTESAWRKLAPRPGSLFLVGDPKQAIYRFRRADIAIYNECKEIMSKSGEVLELTTNFRSVNAIADWVNPVFEGILPSNSGRYQAPYAPLRTVRPNPSDGAFHGVHRITIPKVDRHKEEEIARIDAKRIADWIAWACDGNVTLPRSAEERNQGLRECPHPGDFMILTRTKKRLILYAEALEEAGLPFTISGGSGFAASRELTDLLVLLKAVADPDDPVHLVGTLRGLFFGLSDDLLYRFRKAGGRFSFLGQQPDEVANDGGLVAVIEALEKVRGYWELSRKLPPAAAVEQIVMDTGIIPYAASSEMGDTRAGNLFKALELIRAMDPMGFATVVERFEEIISDEEVEQGHLDPNPVGAVRLMNLHKAKGLEAPVVFLADPCRQKDFEPSCYVDRSQGDALGYYVVQSKRGFRTTILGEPPDWDTWKEEESLFDHAEDDRLLYVAATRAKAALVISSYPSSENGAWSKLCGSLDQVPELPEVPGKQVTRFGVQVKDGEEAKAVDEARAALERAAVASYEQVAVTAVVKVGERPPWQDTEEGMVWGSIVHRYFEVITRNVDRVGNGDLKGLAEKVLAVGQRPAGALDEQVGKLVELAEKLLDSPLWSRVKASPERYSEVPLAGMVDGRLVKGTADLVFREGNEWVIVDYKSDKFDEADMQPFVDYYAPQLRCYGKLWGEATGQRVKEMVIYFAEGGRGIEV